MPRHASDAELADEVERHLALVDAAGDQVGEAERHAQRAERDDERGDLRLRDQEAVEQPPRQARGQRGDEPEQDHAEALAAELVHQLGGDDALRRRAPAPTLRSMPAVTIT
jgi:hypothetical protein